VIRVLCRVAAIAVAAMFVQVAVAGAQTSLQIPLQFDFINPGAKSLALGGAFVALADDATASFANPAGLTQRLRPEMSLEMRGTRTNSVFLQRGRLSGAIINEGTDIIQGPVFGDSPGSHLGIGYFSIVYPIKKRKWVLAFYRHELARVNQTFLSEGVFQKAPEEFTSRRDSPQEGIRSAAIDGYGASAARTLWPGVRVGAGLVLYTFSLDSVFRRFDIDGFLGPPKLNVEFGRSSQEGDDLAVAPVFGFALKRGGANLGVVYRRGASFDFTTADGDDPVRTGKFRVPHTFAFGAYYEKGNWIVTGELTWIGYSRLVEDFVTDQAIATGRASSFGIDDGTEIHGGVQYALLRRDEDRKRTKGPPILFRAGTWYDPDHSVNFTAGPASTTIFDRLFDERLAAALSRGKGQWHATGGVGLTLSSRFQLNAGLDAASRTFIASTSLVIHLGKEVQP